MYWALFPPHNLSLGTRLVCSMQAAKLVMFHSLTSHTLNQLIEGVARDTIILFSHRNEAATDHFHTWK